MVDFRFLYTRHTTGTGAAHGTIFTLSIQFYQQDCRTFAYYVVSAYIFRSSIRQRKAHGCLWRAHAEKYYKLNYFVSEKSIKYPSTHAFAIFTRRPFIFCLILLLSAKTASSGKSQLNAMRFVHSAIVTSATKRRFNRIVMLLLLAFIRI